MDVVLAILVVVACLQAVAALRLGGRRIIHAFTTRAAGARAAPAPRRSASQPRLPRTPGRARP